MHYKIFQTSFISKKLNTTKMDINENEISSHFSSLFMTRFKIGVCVFRIFLFLLFPFENHKLPSFHASQIFMLFVSESTSCHVGYLTVREKKAT